MLRGFTKSYGSDWRTAASAMIDDPAAPTPRREPTAMEWRCGCGRIHRNSSAACPMCGGKK